MIIQSYEQCIGCKAPRSSQEKWLSNPQPVKFGQMVQRETFSCGAMLINYINEADGRMVLSIERRCKGMEGM